MELPPGIQKPAIIWHEIKEPSQISLSLSEYCVTPKQLNDFAKEIMQKGKSIDINQLEKMRDAKDNRHKSFTDEIITLQKLGFAYYAYKINSSVQGELYAVVGIRTDKENKQVVWLSIFDPKEKETVYRSYADEGSEVNITKLIFRMVTGDSEICEYRFGTLSFNQKGKARFGAMPSKIKQEVSYFSFSNLEPTQEFGGVYVPIN